MCLPAEASAAADPDEGVLVPVEEIFPEGHVHLLLCNNCILIFKNKPAVGSYGSATGARERRLIQKSKQPKGNLISTAEFYAVNG